MTPFYRRWALFLTIGCCSLFLLRNISHLRAPTLRQRQHSETSKQTLPAGPFKWRDIPLNYPIETYVPLPSGPSPEIPRIQHRFRQDGMPESTTRAKRLAAVRDAFEHSWKGYRTNAWMHDEVAPVSGGHKDPFCGWGATLVDSLDTLWIMGFKKDFAVAVAGLKQIDFSRCSLMDVNVFETTIRYLGGFLSAYDLSEGKYPELLEKALEVADMLYKAFDTPNHMPITRWQWREGASGHLQQTPKLEIVAELGSLALEFTRLSQLTDDTKYFDAIKRISDVFAKEQNKTLIPGLWPITINPLLGDFHSDNTFTLGGMSDSVFEITMKEYLLLNGKDSIYRDMHVTAMEAIKRYLIFEPLLPYQEGRNPLILGTQHVQNSGGKYELDPRGEHLTCFAGGMFALGARSMAPFRSSADTKEDLDVAKRLVDGCIWSYNATPTGIGPEIFHTIPCRKGRAAVSLGKEVDWEGRGGDPSDCKWDRHRWLEAIKGRPKGENDAQRDRYVQERKFGEGFTSIDDARYILRPEAIESIFLLYRTTGDATLQDRAWTMFESIVNRTKTAVAFAAVPNVMDTTEEYYNQDGERVVHLLDSMESFWTAETLKYFYLLFADEELVSLDYWVFNTEAHPLRWRTSEPS